MSRAPKKPAGRTSRKATLHSAEAGPSAGTPGRRARALVAIGASAGGLEALEKFFDHVPEDSGFAWVVIQHLDPNFRSVMDELLGRHSRLPIRKVESGMPIEPNAIYLNPARHDMSIEHDCFTIRPSEKTGGLNLPINVFFTSAAAEFGEWAIGVILSGTGSDGTKGCEAIKASGGLVFVQEPDSAKFDSMPASVFAKDLADGVDRPENLAKLIIGSGSDQQRKPPRAQTLTSVMDPYAAIFSIIKSRFDIDFTVYKTNTMERRIKRRMGLVGSANLLDYTDMLAVNRDEVANLLKDLLLDVTAFFRDRDAFNILTEMVIVPLVERMDADVEIRVWVAGCSTGEEAYSIAICFAECAAARGKALNLKILATDIHMSSLAVASTGLYQEEAFAAVPLEIVERYFDRDGDGLRIKKTIRRLVVFSQHNLLKDPPFARIDLLTCRNVLIYFNEDAQKFALSLFHFTLVVGGTVFLGPSETLGPIADEFKAVSQKWRIYAKARNTRLLGSGVLMARGSAHVSARSLDTAGLRSALSPSTRDMARATTGALRELLTRYAPPGFLIGRDGTLLHVFGDATKYILLKPGVFSQKIIELLPRELALLVASGLGNPNREAFRRFRRSIRRTTDSGETLEIVTLESLSETDLDHLLLTIDSKEATPPQKEVAATEATAKSLDENLDLRRLNEELRADLQSTEENLQSAIEELATSNEELQSTNEELMASNEELQSTNEELHSVNEELYTVSAEHQRKIDELMQLTLDMEHLLKATQIGTIFLDEKMYVRRFTPAAVQAFNLIPQDIGRPITHITVRFQGVDFLGLLDAVNASQQVREAEVSVDGHPYLLRVLPYRAEVSDPRGAVVTLIDIGALKSALAKVRELDRLNQAILSGLSESILCWDAVTETILFCNEVFASTVIPPAEVIVGRKKADVLGRERYETGSSAVEEMATNKTAQRVVQATSETGDAVWRSIAYSRIDGDDGLPLAYLACGHDITDRVHYTSALEALSTLENPVGDSIEAFIRSALRIGQEYLGVSYGLLAKIGSDGHEVVSFFGPRNPKFIEGSAVTLPHDLCEKACTVKTGLCLFNAAPSPPAQANVLRSDHRPAEAADAQFCEFEIDRNLFGAGHRGEEQALVREFCNDFHNYIGMRVYVSGRRFGTLSFFSEETTAARSFSEIQRGFVRQLAQWIGLKIDAHDHHQALLRSEMQLKSVFNRMPQRIWHIDSQNRIVGANAAAEETFQTAIDATEGAGADGFMSAIDAGWSEHSTRVIDDRVPLYGVSEQLVDTPTGKRWISTDLIPHTEAVTGAPSILVVANDVTPLKEREAALQIAIEELDTNRWRFEQLYRRTPAMMCSFDRGGRLIEVSDMWLEKTGFSREEVIGRRLSDFLDIASKAVFEEHYAPERWRDGFLGTVALVVRSRDGSRIEVDMASDRGPETGEKAICLAVLVDVTARNDAERALERANRELATANEGLRKFAHIASHDLQEPLRKISQFGDLLAQEFGERLDGDGRFYVGVMRDSADRMRALVRDILTFSKSVNAVFEREPLALDELVQEILAELDVAVREAGATLDVEPLPVVSADRTALLLLLRNLFSNSLKYRRTDVLPKISVKGAWSGSAHYRIHLADNGCGFDPRYKEAIFDPFTRLHTRSEVEGSGIGLAICRSVCERHRWEISADGTAGMGAEFTITIPAEDIDRPDDEARRHV